ncbi:hypothetical protein ACFSC3_08965 [Sphingomonas floccifaciens]|uniref:AMP-binding enzyme C-terminal domain-containing protein n=1 Tax=Sphingomonas floccifaciens TaxID=1844115 RepID=A0ABW4NCJ0_9SPHN
MNDLPHDVRVIAVQLAVVVPDENATPTLEDVNAAIGQAIASGALSRYARLERIALVDALPRTSVGKIDKKALRARLTPPSPAP